MCIHLHDMLGNSESQNIRTVGAGRDLQRSYGPIPLQSRTPTAGCISRRPGGSWVSPEKENPQPPWQPVPVLHYPHCEEFPSHIGAELPVVQFMAISPCPVPTDCWREVGHVSLTPMLKIFININQIPSESSFLKAEQTQFAQLFLIREMLQALYHLCGPLLDSLQEIPVFFVPGSPELATVLSTQVQYWR